MLSNNSINLIGWFCGLNELMFIKSSHNAHYTEQTENVSCVCSVMFPGKREHNMMSSEVWNREDKLSFKNLSFLASENLLITILH